MIKQRGPRCENTRPSGRKRQALIGTGLCVGAALLLKWLLDARLLSNDAGMVLVILCTMLATFLLTEPKEHPSAKHPRSNRGKPEVPDIGSSDQERRN